jgi:hypothetical protein
MFKQLSILALASSLATTVTAVGNARVVNHCDFEVTLWSVGSQISNAHTLHAHGGRYGEQFSRDPKTGGRALKVTRERDGLYTGKAQTIFAYTLDPDRVFYDLSDVFGDPFAGCKLTLVPSNGQCSSIVWEHGKPPGPSQTRDCGNDCDVTLTLCA